MHDRHDLAEETRRRVTLAVSGVGAFVSLLFIIPAATGRASGWEAQGAALIAAVALSGAATVRFLRITLDRWVDRPHTAAAELPRPVKLGFWAFAASCGALFALAVHVLG